MSAQSRHTRFSAIFQTLKIDIVILNFPLIFNALKIKSALLRGLAHSLQ
jgi:hypothetical protein